jgi:hypothetical protein
VIKPRDVAIERREGESIMMRSLIHVALAASCLLLPACGETLSVGGPQGADAGVDGAAAPDGAPPSGRPSTLPTIGAACTQPAGANYEYGDAYRLACDTVVTCEDNAWTVVPIAQLAGTACQPDRAVDCPASLADITPGDTCAVTGECSYPEGACGCEAKGGAPYSATDNVGAQWSCLQIDASCPYPRPRAGTTCSVPSATCIYEFCTYTERCEDGVWTLNFSMC